MQKSQTMVVAVGVLLCIATVTADTVMSFMKGGKVGSVPVGGNMTSDVPEGDETQSSWCIEMLMYLYLHGEAELSYDDYYDEKRARGVYIQRQECADFLHRLRNLLEFKRQTGQILTAIFSIWSVFGCLKPSLIFALQRCDLVGAVQQ